MQPKRWLYKKISIKIELIYSILSRIKYITMDTNKENITTITLIREHDKICFLEGAIQNIPGILSITEVESIVSNLIDSITVNNEINIQHYSNLLRNKVNNSKMFNTIIQVSEAIGKNLPLLLSIEVNKVSMKYINYITNNNQNFLPLF